VFPLGVSTVTCHIGTASATFQVTVADRTPPALRLPAAVTADAPSPRGAFVAYAVTATDAVDGLVAPVCTLAAGARFSLGPTTVTCRVVDRAGNVATGAFAVRVADDRAQLAALRAYVVAAGRAGRPLLAAVDAVAEALAAGAARRADMGLVRLGLQARLSGLSAVQRAHVVGVVERLRRYQRRVGG
jgi:hypothetical protein